MKKSAISIVIGATVLSGCATPAANVTASYVSPVLYQNLTCEQLALEAQTISTRVVLATGAQDKKANGDVALMAVGLVVFWPALLFTNGDGQQAAELARLKGEIEAVENASNRNNCGLVFQHAPPAKPKHKQTVSAK